MGIVGKILAVLAMLSVAGSAYMTRMSSRTYTYLRTMYLPEVGIDSDQYPLLMVQTIDVQLRELTNLLHHTNAVLLAICFLLMVMVLYRREG